MRLIGKKGFNLPGSINIGTNGKGSCVLMSPDLMFCSDGDIRVGRELDQAMHPSFLVPPVQACGGYSVMIWG